MGYISPGGARYYKGHVSAVRVIYDSGPAGGSWSVARLTCDGKEKAAIRWNRDDDAPGAGAPSSRARWFIVPDELAEVVVHAAERLNHEANQKLVSGYQAMAQDAERENEALAWSEGLIGDISEAR